MSGNDLHLPNLTIRRFRGIRDLSIEHLGRVTLIAGKNGVGKTTLLDAVRTYAERGTFAVLSSILRKSEELTKSINEDGDDVVAPDWGALFYGRRVWVEHPIAIGPLGGSNTLSIRVSQPSKEEADWLREFTSDHLLIEEGNRLGIRLEGDEQSPQTFSVSRVWSSRDLHDESAPPPGIRCESLGPGVLENADIARLWDKVALTADEDRAVQALGLVFGEKIGRAGVIGDDTDSRTRYGRRAVVRIEGQEYPVPLRSLGDGAVRLFGVALALVNSRGGFLLIDEAENGIHYSLQRDFWRMVLLTAQANNVQVFATTHSWDCAAGFAQAAVEAEDVEGALVRLERDGENIRAVEYSERQLQVAAEQGIEVR